MLSPWLLYLPSSHHKHSHPSKPFHILSEFAAITDRWAVVICHTLQCQQQPQDEWLRSSVVLWTRGCASSFTQKSESCNRVCTSLCSLPPCWNCVFGEMAVICRMNYLVDVLLPPSLSRPALSPRLVLVMRNRHADILFAATCTVTSLFFRLHVFVHHSALPMAPRPPTMMLESCCVSHRGWRIRVLLTSCLTGHVIPGSGTAVISKYLMQTRFYLISESCFTGCNISCYGDHGASEQTFFMSILVLSLQSIFIYLTNFCTLYSWLVLIVRHIKIVVKLTVVT